MNSIINLISTHKPRYKNQYSNFKKGHKKSPLLHGFSLSTFFSWIGKNNRAKEQN